MKFTKILIANRGEIAVRIIRSCRDMGIQTVAVYSEPDRKHLHVRLADEAVCIGPALAKESYLSIEKIIRVALEKGAQAIHPGYGFLSENPLFAKAVEDAGLILIGPSAFSMEVMGSKTKARQFMEKAGVPVVPGLLEPAQTEEEAFAFAQKIGFPVMLKAAAGGGGKGMRRINAPSEFASAFRAAQSEAKNSFGDDAVYVEKFLEKPRHIEVQVLADASGRVVSFPERECSVQRRHQKVIEESPSPFVHPEMRLEMGKIARKAAEAVRYKGAGTIEFLVDAHKNFYFMEMNTRLQVEHPVTEMITGLDLVEWQIRIAQGERLTFSKDDIPATGWAMEARICAEDPSRNFMPTPGPLHHFISPQGPYVRMDTGVYSGSEVSIHYDSMIAKLIAWGESRDQSRRRLKRALLELNILGCTTNVQFVGEVLDYDSFKTGNYDTSILDKSAKVPASEEDILLAALVGALWKYEKEKTPSANSFSGTTPSSRWRQLRSPFLVGQA